MLKNPPAVWETCVWSLGWESTFTESSFMIWNSLPGILSPPLALFAVMLPKAHLTSLCEGKHLHCIPWVPHGAATSLPSNRQNFQRCPGLSSPSSLTFSTWRHFKSPYLCSPQSTLRFKMRLPKSQNKASDTCGRPGKRAKGALVVTTNDWKLSVCYISLILMKQTRQIWWCRFIILGMLCCPQHGSRPPWG